MHVSNLHTERQPLLYAMHQQKPGDTEKDEFCNTLQDVWSRLPEHDTKLLLGDLNAKLGKNNNLGERVIGCHGTGRLNNNGMRFVQFCEINYLFISSASFQHANIHKYTWISRNGLYRSQIDHLAVSKNQIGCILDVKVSRSAEWTLKCQETQTITLQ